MIPRQPQPDMPLFSATRKPQRTEPDERSIDDAFREFEREHPEVFRYFQKFAEEIRGRGWTRYSADAILHRIRWHCHVEKGDRDLKINDHFSSRYARLLISVDPTFADFFELRRIKS